MAERLLVRLFVYQCLPVPVLTYLALHVQDPRIAVVERALTALAALAELSGSFLARRLSAEAWPQLAQLLRKGPVLTRTPSMLPEEERHAPAVLQRARLAVLACLHKCAFLGSCGMAAYVASGPRCCRKPHSS